MTHSTKAPQSSMVRSLERALSGVYALLRAKTDQDLTRHSLADVRKGIENRMARTQTESIQSYLKFCSETPYELEALLQDLLLFLKQLDPA